MSERASHPRALAIDGLYNARDLGGLPAADGRRVARGRLYRAEVLTDPGGEQVHAVWNERNHVSIAALGIRTVIDLRGEAEAAATPSVWAEAGGGIRHSLPIHDGGHGAARDYVDMLLTGRLSRFGGEDLGAHYIDVLEARAETFGAAVAIIADDAPALVHCTEGKDRTGLLVALVLAAVGTPEHDIVEDYALTSLWRPDRALAYGRVFSDAGVALEDFRTLYESPAVAMEMALAHLADAHGSVSSYLRDRAAVDAAVVARLRDALLEPAPDPGEG